MSSPHYVRRESLSDRVRSLASINTSRPQVDIEINTPPPPCASLHPLAYVHTFSTKDTIAGTVTITVSQATRLDDVEIAFVGTIKTFVDKMNSSAAVSGRTEAFHQFLKLTQPILQSAYPPDLGVAEAGKPYTFPFTFVVPERLLPNACRHPVVNGQVREAHLQLPPSLGEPELSGQGPTLLDDLSPDMVKISYAVKVTVSRTRERDGRLVPLVSKLKKARIIPVFDEAPPLTVDSKPADYCLRREKGIKKGMFKGKLGRLVMEASQPQSFRLPPAAAATAGTAEPASTMATVMLRFDPTSDSVEPPRLGSLVSKLKVATFFASAPRHSFPCKATLLYDVSQSVHVEALSLSQRNVQSVQWQRHEPWQDAQHVRRDSTMSNVSVTEIPAPSFSYAANQGRPFYTAKLLVPIALPKHKSFVPTFHSCLASRVYTLDFSLSIPAPKGSAVATSMTLKVPAQVTSEGHGADPSTTITTTSSSSGAAVSPTTLAHAASAPDADSPPQLFTDGPSAAAAQAQAQEDASLTADFDFAFAPRSVAPPRLEYLGRSSLSHAPALSQRQGSVVSMAEVEESTVAEQGQQQQQQQQQQGQQQQMELPPEYSHAASRRSGAVGVYG